jgi:outer membrane immunogenic protein
MKTSIMEEEMNLVHSGQIGLAMMAVAGFAALPAMADGRRGPPPHVHYEEPYPAIWHGVYGGVHLGWGEAGTADGVIGGAQIGYNWQAGRIVYALEADISLSDISVEEHFGPIHASASVDWLATARGRVGYLLDPRILGYVTAGFGIASGSAQAHVPGIAFKIDDTETDFVYGLGLEGKINERMSARIEYLAFSDLDIDVVRAGLNFKIGQ